MPTSPGGISANYIYYLEKVIQGYYGKDCVVVFLAGASGDVTQVDNRSDFVNPKPDQWAHAISNQGTFPTKAQNEAYKAFKLSDPNAEPQEEFYPTAYTLVLELFNGLQAAGPTLTPTIPASSASAARQMRPMSRE